MRITMVGTGYVGLVTGSCLAEFGHNVICVDNNGDKIAALRRGEIQEIARGIGLDNRIGTKFLHAGPGFGGSCFPKDTRALIKTAQDHLSPVRIVEAVVSVNENRKRAMARKVAAVLGGTVRGKTVSILGLTFKPNTDDVRESPAIPLITALQDLGAKVKAFDPEGMEQARTELSDVTYCDGPYSCAEGSDALVIVTEWEQFRALDFARLNQAMANPVLIDLRNIYRPEHVISNGFVYQGVARAGQNRTDASSTQVPSSLARRSPD